MAQIRWPDEVQQKIGILEAASGAGIFVGPVFGSLINEGFQHVNENLAYCLPFFLFSGMLITTLPFCMKGFDKDLDTNRPQIETEIGENGIMKHQVGAVGMIRYKRVLFAFLSQVINLIIFTLGDPIFGPHLEDNGLPTW